MEGARGRDGTWRGAALRRCLFPGVFPRNWCRGSGLKGGIRVSGVRKGAEPSAGVSGCFPSKFALKYGT